MAKIALRAYNREIETVIDHGQIEEAIAHCKYILRFFPKHIETYRLLGKAYIESQRYSEAADILQRILSVLPDDFVAQIGMSIVREDEGNLDAALFHMEHAHEIQPSNGAVQDELRRLYGRRDGLEPPRLRLTRGALVRLYAKGDLYRQAIAEIRAALTEDPNRFDLEVILARMYSLLGQKVEATDVASRLVAKLPYCMEANKILAEILPTTSRAEDAKTYQQRIFALDPYLAYISPNAPTSNLVPDNAVTLDRLEFKPTAAGEAQPDWARNAGIPLGGEEEVETLPDWLTPPPEVEQSNETGLIGQSALVNEPTGENTPAISSESPDWMQEAGWASSSQGIQETTNLEEEAAAPADLPDWLKSMAPAEGTTTQPQENDSKLDWLDQILPQTGTPSENEFVFPGVEGLAAGNQDLPSASQPTEGQAIESPGAGFDESLPSWLNFPEAKTVVTERSPEEIGKETTSSTIESLPAEANVPTAEVEQIPTQALPETPPQVTETEPVTGEALTETTLPSEVDEQVPSEGLAEPTVPVEAIEQVPFVPLAEPVQTAAEIADIPPEAISDKFVEQGTSNAHAEPPLQSEVLEQTPSETVPEPVLPAVESGQIPVEARSEAPEEIAGEITPAQGSSEQVVVPVELAAEAQPDWNDLDAAMAWLEGLAAKQGADQETLSTTEEQRSQTPPTWVTQEMEKSQAEAQTSPGTSSLEQGQPIDAGITEVSQTLPVEQPVSELPSEPITQAVASPPQPLEVESIDNISPPVFEQTIPEPLPSENNAEISTVFSSAPAIEETTIEQQITAEKKTAPLKLPAEPTPAQDMDGDAAFAWLESLAAQQGADEGTLSTSIEERQIPPPTWILEQGEAESKTEAPQDVNEAVALINETAVVEPQASSPAEEQTVSPELLPVSEIPAIEVPSLRDEAIQPVETGSWIKEPEQPAPPEATAQAVTPVPMTLPEEEPLPAWLKDIDQPPLETSSLVAPESMDDLPDWLKGFETPLEGSPIQAGDESTSVSTWLQEQENHAPEEINPPAPIAEPVLALDDKPLQSIPLPTAANSAASASLEDLPTNGNPLIAQAQADLKAGNIDTALSSFNQAIEQGQNLDAVIQNLKDALNRHPVEISLWQTLGDAYMRNDQIQDALDAYTKAEELLR